MAIEKPTNQRPNYFAGQYLLEDDFQLDQDYHIDRQRWHHHLLHISGIAEGLTVNKGESDLVVNVSEGSAIDSQGRQIILLDSLKVDLIKSYSSSNATILDGTYTLYIGYDQKKTDQQSAGEENTSRRWQEKPEFKLSSAELTDFIPLAKLTINSNAVSGNIDNSVRFYSGLRLPSYDGAITLRSKSDGTQSFAELKGSLSIAGILSVAGNVGIGTSTPTEKLEITDGNLKVSGNISASNASLTGNLGIGTSTPTEKLVIRGGNLRVNGNISAYSLTVFVRSDDKTPGLNIVRGDYPDDPSLLYLTNLGNLGIGTTTPRATLEVKGSTKDNKAAGLSVTDSDANSLLYVRNDGNVGIGTINPGMKLAISASANHLQLRREKTETSGGKLLFLELYQDDSNSAVPEIYPSIRFHHFSRYWHRIEARTSGLHFKNGSLDVDNYINIYAANIYAANVASCPETLNMIRGTVEANGTSLAGTGFTVTKNDIGLYTITFSTAFTNFPPTVVATQQYPNQNDFVTFSGDTRANAVILGVSTTRCLIKCGDSGGSVADRRFHFIAIGPR